MYVKLMGTSGYFGFRYKKKYYMIYNHYDSYFSGLGKDLLNEVKEMINNNKFDEWLLLFLQLEMVKQYDEDYEPSYESDDEDDEINEKNYEKKCEAYQKYKDDYDDLLKKSQGSFIKVLKSGYAPIDKYGSLKNDGIIEYCYVLDFDTKLFYASHNNIIVCYGFTEIPNMTKLLELDLDDE